LPPESHLEEDVRSHAKTITEIVAALNLRNVEDARRDERDKARDERLDRIEESIKAVYGLGKWVLAAIGGVFVTAIVGFILKGGPLG
jgi:hypothetical protein